MLMFLGISGRFMFFTADTARAGAPAMPACMDTHTYTHTHGELIRHKPVKQNTCYPLQDTEQWALDTHEHTTTPQEVLNGELDKKKKKKKRSTADKMQKHRDKRHVQMYIQMLYSLICKCINYI